ncbi:hypothetical protein CHR29_28155 (plasmid) [Pseudomonas monteilii]|nr:hypothetical protein CHR29_28155 [Pseudomonas monteilii]
MGFGMVAMSISAHTSARTIRGFRPSPHLLRDPFDLGCVQSEPLGVIVPVLVEVFGKLFRVVVSAYAPQEPTGTISAFVGGMRAIQDQFHFLEQFVVIEGFK